MQDLIDYGVRVAKISRFAITLPDVFQGNTTLAEQSYLKRFIAIVDIEHPCGDYAISDVSVPTNVRCQQQSSQLYYSI